MATQKCPRCNSDRVKTGYRPTSLLKKLTFRYNLLCDNCNWEFSGFAIPGTVPTKTRKRRKKTVLDKMKLTAETAGEETEQKERVVLKAVSGQEIPEKEKRTRAEES